MTRVKFERKNAMIKPRHLADILGIATTSYLYKENTSSFTIREYLLLCDILGINIDDLI